MSKKFPDVLYATHEDPEEDGGYFVADTKETSAAVLGEKTLVGVYKLVEMREVEGVVNSRVV